MLTPLALMAAYEQATNSHDISRVMPLIAPEATYWFTDGSYVGLDAIRSAIESTFATIQNEVYEIRDLEWIALSDETAVCRYRFVWQGTLDGLPRHGAGLGTNVLVKRADEWLVLHEHLSA
jgi:ketosteroid isomerase-like protein